MTVPESHARTSKPFGSWRGSHVGIRVADFDAAVDWYIAMLEFRLTETMQHGSTRFGILTLPTDDAFGIEIIANPNGAPRPSYRNLPDSHALMGWHHICLGTSDIDTDIEELRSRGVRIVSEARDVDDWGIRFAFIADPWGNLIELLQSKS